MTFTRALLRVHLFFFRGSISLHAALPFIIPFGFVRGASNDFVCDSLPN